jgi:hypothetical protein
LTSIECVWNELLVCGLEIDDFSAISCEIKG